MSAPRRIVLLGMLAKMPVPGVVWQTVHYLLGLRQLGFEPYYVEAHGRAPSMLMERDTDDGSGRAAALLDSVLGAFGLGDRWAYQALHDDGRCYGLSEAELGALYREAELIINLHGGTQPREELSRSGRLVFLETDPVRLQIELHDEVAASIDFLDAHCAFFTFAENLGRPECSLPVCERFPFHPTRQPVVRDLWQRGIEPSAVFTTIGNWRQRWRTVRYQGEEYGWSKDVEWRKFLDLPKRTGQDFELALSGYEPAEAEELQSHGWKVKPALEFSTGYEAYRDFICGSRAEFTVAKDQNVRFHTGWFSDRSATYLAAGRPVITQDTGFGSVLPTGVGLFAVADVEAAAAAVEQIAADPRRHGRAAAELAREHFDAERVLGRLLDDLGVSPPSSKGTMSKAPTDHDTTPSSTATLSSGRRRLGQASTVLALIPHFHCEEWLDDCLGSLERQTRPLDGIVVIDDASDDPPLEIVRRHPTVTLLHAERNVGPYRLIQQVIDDTDYDAYLFQDADDWSAPDRLQRQLEEAERSGAEMVGSQEVRVFCDEPEAVPIAWPLDANAPFRERATAFSLLHPTSLVSSDLLEALGGFSSGLRFGGDAELLRRAQHLATLRNVPEHGYYRRVRQNSLTTAPATAIGTPVRKQLMEETFARANRNAELVAAGREPDLSPLRTAPPVQLRHLAGPLLRTPGAAPTSRAPRSSSAPATTSDDVARPVFVVGAERSGATALACALGQHPNIGLNLEHAWMSALATALVDVRAQALETDANAFGAEPPPAEAFASAIGPGAAALATTRGGRWISSATQHATAIAPLSSLFPEARFIHLVRDVHSSVRALTDPPLGSAGATGGTQVPARLRTKVSEQDALRSWLTAVEGASEAQALLGDERMLTVTFSDLVAQPEAVVQRCLEFVGEEPREECLRPLRALRSLVDSAALNPDVDPEEWQRGVSLSDEILAQASASVDAAVVDDAGLPPRIVMVTDHFPKFSETFFVRKFLGLLRRGWDVHVVSQRSNKEHWEYFPTLREEIGELDRLHVARDDLESKILELEPDIVHFGYGSLACDRMHLREALGCKIVVSFRGFDINSFRLDEAGCYDDVWRGADAVHAVSESIWRRTRARGCPPDVRHEIISDAVDVDRFQPPAQRDARIGTPQRPLRLLSVGRLSWKKGHEYALLALRQLLDQGIDATYRIIGEGEQRESTQFAIADLGLERHVELLGARQGDEVRDAMAWADVFVHPSLTEAFGVAVAEAQAMALPVVCSDAGGLPENVADGVTGFVVPRRDAAALAHQLVLLVHEPERRRRMSAAARRRAEATLSLEYQLDRFEQLYDDLLKEPAAAPAPVAADVRGAARRRRLGELRETLSAVERQQASLHEQVWRREVVEEVHAFVAASVPEGARVAVVSRGDEEIVAFSRHAGAHFPQAHDGAYAGHHPADSAAAIAQLRALCEQGTDYLIIPGTSLWWLEHYEEFARHLDEAHERVAELPRSYVAYALRARTGERQDEVRTQRAEAAVAG